MQQEVQAHLLGQAGPVARAAAVSQFRGAGAPRGATCGARTYFKKLLGDVEESTAPLGLPMCRGTGFTHNRSAGAVDAQLARRSARAPSLRSGVRRAACVTWRMRRCSRGPLDGTMWCLARCSLGACQSGERCRAA